MDGIVFVTVSAHIFERVTEYEAVRVSRLRFYVHACHIESGAFISFTRSALTAKQIQQTRHNKSLETNTRCPLPLRGGVSVIMFVVSSMIIVGACGSSLR